MRTETSCRKENSRTAWESIFIGGNTGPNELTSIGPAAKTDSPMTPELRVSYLAAVHEDAEKSNAEALNFSGPSQINGLTVARQQKIFAAAMEPRCNDLQLARCWE